MTTPHTPNLQRVIYLPDPGGAKEAFSFGLGKMRMIFENVRGVFMADDVDIAHPDVRRAVAPRGMSVDHAQKNQYLLFVSGFEHGSMSPAELRAFYDTDHAGILNYIRGQTDVSWLKDAVMFFQSKGLANIETACQSRLKFLGGAGSDLAKNKPVAKAQAEAGAEVGVGSAEALAKAPKKRGRKPKALSNGPTLVAEQPAESNEPV